MLVLNLSVPHEAEVQLEVQLYLLEFYYGQLYRAVQWQCKDEIKFLAAIMLPPVKSFQALLSLLNQVLLRHVVLPEVEVKEEDKEGDDVRDVHNEHNFRVCAVVHKEVRRLVQHGDELDHLHLGEVLAPLRRGGHR